jgi:6,7-dimethyl-8-ribityllumazine synthase
LDLGIAKRETIFNRLKNPKIGIVVSSYYADIARDLTFGAAEVLKKNSIPRKNIIIWNAPGILEIPVMIAKNIHSCSAFIALGCVIKGETPHFDLISKTTIKAIMDLSIKYKKPIGNGIITCLNKKQAAERSDRTKKNKGGEAARAALSVLGGFKGETTQWST